MLRRILIPLDGSPFPEAALHPALTLAAKTGGEIRLLCVLEMPAIFVYPEYPSPDRSWAEEYLEGIAERARSEWDGPISTCVREGSVTDEMAAEAIQWGADLIAMSTHGRGGLSRLWMGSIADRFVRSGVRPVLLVRPGENSGAESPGGTPIRRVVIPLDGSGFSETALPYGSALAKSLAVPVLLLQGVTHVSGVEFTTSPEATELGHRLLDERRKDAADYLEKHVTKLRRLGIDANALAITEPGPAEAIVDRAPGDVVVMATHGRGGFDRAIFGSVTDKVVRTATQPVLVIPPERRSRHMGMPSPVVAGLP
jgi:nucleotide-binding universal stress UspA family protein